MSTVDPAGVPPSTFASRRRGAVSRLMADSVVIARRSIAKTWHHPDSLIGVTVLPVVFTLLFGYVIGPAVSLTDDDGHVAAGGNAFHAFLVSGMFAFTMVNAAGRAAVGIASDIHEGIVDRFRSLPMSRAGVLLGRSLADLAIASLAIAVVAVTGVIIGWRPGQGAGQTVSAFALVLLFAYALEWVMLCVGLAIGSVEGADQTRLLLMFLLGMVSTALIPVDNLAGWLQGFAYWNPVSVVAVACRHLFGNPNPAAAASAWPMQHPVVASLLWSTVIIAVFAPAAFYLYRTRTNH